MARRRRRELGTFEMLTILPWWVGVIVAIVAYLGLAVHLPSKWAGNPVLSPSIPLVAMFGKVLAGLALLAAAISAIKRLFAARSTAGYSPHGSGSHIIPPSRTVPPPEIQVECPNCRNELVAPGELAGEKVRCEACRTEFEVPRPVIKFPDATHFYFGKPKEAVPYRFSLELLQELEWKRFEQLVAGYFTKAGWETRPNSVGPDGGIDIELLRPGQPGVAAVVQCKGWSTNQVGVQHVRQLLGVMTKHNVAEGYFVTSSGFTQEATDFAKGQPLTLIDGPALLRAVSASSAPMQSELLALATKGDYRTPICPSCGRKMVVRVAGKGKNVGEQFWGCPAFPDCRGMLKMKSW